MRFQKYFVILLRPRLPLDKTDSVKSQLESSLFLFLLLLYMSSVLALLCRPIFLFLLVVFLYNVLCIVGLHFVFVLVYCAASWRNKVDTYYIPNANRRHAGVVDATVSNCARYSDTHGCKEMFWTAGQRIDMNYKKSPFVWKQTPGTGACCGGSCMTEMRYTSWQSGEPNNSGGRDGDMKRVSTALPEKCVQLCRGTKYSWNDGVCEIPTCSICEVDI